MKIKNEQGTSPKRQIHCSEIWGGNQTVDTEVCTGALTASLYSSGIDGESGGDIYYFSVCGKEMLTRIAVADVAGHGKTVSDTSHWLYRAMVTHMNDFEGDTILQELNVMAVNQGISAMTTAEVVTFNKKDSTLSYSNAGHPPPLIRRSGDKGWGRLVLNHSSEKSNLPLGVMEEVSYEREAVVLGSGDLLFLYTDGVTDARNREGGKFGNDGLLRTLNEVDDRNIDTIKSTILSSLNGFTGGGLNHDDVTFLALQIH